MSILFNVLGTIVKHVAKRNRDNNDVKTADPVVFEEIQKKVDHVNAGTNEMKDRGDLLKEYYEKIREAQVENEASPVVETADKSVYDDLVQEIEKLKMQVEHQRPHIELPQSQVEKIQKPQVVQAWNSTGGTIEARTSPNMGAEKSTLRIPNKGVFSVLEYSENSIILDGQKSRFVLVESNNERGWILERYLNFN